MYIPPPFRETQLDVLHSLIRAHSFGTLVSQVNGELIATHLPFLLDPARGEHGTLTGHMARANPHWQSFLQPELEQSMAVFLGPHAYISPSWYASPRNVPTWNYIAVHAYGIPSIVDNPQRVREILETTVRTFEAGSPNPWSTAGLPEAYIADMYQAGRQTQARTEPHHSRHPRRGRRIARAA
ncbi:MAG: FMN-binding negative transcriptional regulator [Chloroflexi bacterium]|nr:MAG: FMN-binding negative transcriptional regulator [Chloroflexota bacterium]